MLMRMDGRRTFEEIAREVHALEPGRFTFVGLLNFYNWLNREDLIVCECESVFELVLDESEDDEVKDGPQFAPVGARQKHSFREYLGSAGASRMMKISAAILFSLSVLRLAYVAAPIFEPPVDRLYSEVGKLMGPRSSGVSLASSERSAQIPGVEKVELASQMKSAPREVGVQSNLNSADEEALALPQPEALPKVELIKPDIEELRVKLEECRIRRDEFYLQNNEEGYRREVHAMTELAKEIGDIED